MGGAPMNAAMRDTVITANTVDDQVIFDILEKKPLGVCDDRRRVALDRGEAAQHELARLRLPSDYHDSVVFYLSNGLVVVFDVSVSNEGYGGNSHEVSGPFILSREDFEAGFANSGRVVHNQVYDA